MATLGNLKSTVEVIQKYQFAFQKKFGQSFLTDTRVLGKTISVAGITGDDCVLETRPGIGTMVQYLAGYAGRVVAAGTDTNLLPILDEALEGYSSVTVTNSDILKLDMSQLVDEYNNGRSIKMMVDPPHYITMPIIMGLFEDNMPVDNATVMVQKEAADRMQVGPGSKNYGALSLAMQYYTKPYIVANVPPNCFTPRPNAGSAVIHLMGYKEPPVQVDGPGIMSRLIRTSLSQCRKTLQNELNNSPEAPYIKEQIAVATEGLGVPASVRGEALMLEQFAGLSNYFIYVAGNGVQGLQYDIRNMRTGSVMYFTGIKGNSPGRTIIRIIKEIIYKIERKVSR